MIEAAPAARAARLKYTMAMAWPVRLGRSYCRSSLECQTLHCVQIIFSELVPRFCFLCRKACRLGRAGGAFRRALVPVFTERETRKVCPLNYTPAIDQSRTEKRERT